MHTDQQYELLTVKKQTENNKSFWLERMLAGSQRSHRLHKPQRFKALRPVKLMVYKVRQVQVTEGFNKPTELRMQALLRDKGFCLVWWRRTWGTGTLAGRAGSLPWVSPSGCPQGGPCTLQAHSLWSTVGSCSGLCGNPVLWNPRSYLTEKGMSTNRQIF